MLSDWLIANLFWLPAQTLLGETNYEQRNLGEAYRWLSIAAESGSRRAQLDLAELNVRRDLASEQVNPDSLKALGRSAADTINDIQKWQQQLRPGLLTR